MKRIGKNSGIQSINNINQNRTMITNRFLKTLALPVAAALGMFAASCSNDDNILDEQQPSAAKYEIPVTVSATRSGDDASTRAVYDSESKKLNFEEGDQLFIQGTDATAGTFAGLLSNTAGAPGTFSGTLTTTSEYTGTFGELFSSATSLTATLLPKDYGTEAAGYLTLSGSGASQTLTVDATKAFVTAASADAAKKLAIEQLSLEQATAYSTGFALAPVNAVLNYSIAANSLSAGTHTMFVHNGNGLSISGSITAVTDAATTFAVALPADASTSRNYSLCTLGYNDIVKTGKALTEGKVFNISATASENANAPLPGAFTVGDGKQVRFAKGNLRYASGTWSFFDNQYDYYTSYSADAWDKFGWSTSATTYGMNTSTSNTYSSDFVDWGATMGTGWRTLTSDEWEYIFNTRAASTVNSVENARYAKATVAGKTGMILFPDTYTHPSDVTQQPTSINTANAAFTSNSYDATAWGKMEAAGCIFLPAAGYRYGTYVYGVGSSGDYWSSKPNDTNYAYGVLFSASVVSPQSSSSRYNGYSVRLVRDAE